MASENSEELPSEDRPGVIDVARPLKRANRWSRARHGAPTPAMALSSFDKDQPSVVAAFGTVQLKS
jgi:hypothetical protein